MDSSIIFYIFPILLSLLGACQYDFSKHAQGKNFVWGFLFIYLVALMGFRYEVGGDTLTYMNWYKWASDLDSWQFFDIKSPYEPGFTFLAAVAKSINKEFYVLQLIHAIIFNSMLFYFISTYSRYRFSALLMCFLMYYLYFSTEILRESIPVFIFILNIKSFINRKWTRYYIGIIFCIFFHLSSSILLLLPLARNLKFNYTFFIVTFCFILICICIKPIFNILDGLPGVGSKIESYNKNDFAGYLWALLRVFQYTVLPFIALFFARYSLHRVPQFEFSYLILILLGIGVIFNPVIFSRFANYFFPLYSLSLTTLICDSLRNIKINHRIIGITLSMLSIIGYGTYFVYLNFYEMWVPYSSIFNPHNYSFRYRFANGGQG